MDQTQNTIAGIGEINGSIKTEINAIATVDDSNEKLNQIINSNQKILELLHQLKLTVSSFTPASQLHLLQRL
jgi:mediator of RNA polymerase II transcription subunit 10